MPIGVSGMLPPKYLCIFKSAFYCNISLQSLILAHLHFFRNYFCVKQLWKCNCGVTPCGYTCMESHHVTNHVTDLQQQRRSCDDQDQGCLTGLSPACVSWLSCNCNNMYSQLPLPNMPACMQRRHPGSQ